MAASKMRFVLGRQSSLAPEGSSGSSRDGDTLTSAELRDEVIQLLYLASMGDVDGVKTLLDSGVDVNSKDFDFRTALHLAACEGHKEVAELLVREGAAMNATDCWGSTPLADARHYKQTEVCRFLEGCGAKTRVQAALSTNNIPEYEVNPAEIKLKSNFEGGRDIYRLAVWRGTKVFIKTIPTECLVEGNLQEHLKRIGQPLKPVKAVNLALYIARGINYLHERKPDAIIHRNLNPSNLWRGKAGHLKVAGFSFSKRLSMASGSVRETEEGLLSGSSCRYMAPELFQRKAHDRKVDVFSFGLILQEMIEGSPPWVDQSAEDVARAYAYNDTRPPFKVKAKYYPAGLKELIVECWDKDPKRRPSFDDIIARLENIKRECTETNSFQRFITHVKYSTLLSEQKSL